ncbi:NifU family protein [Xanthovirga aplysinae]|uniref:NifU family protein n=1 Tax=Xanthovirga aplysinae TaxID=2529853 RepID=UPI0012BCC9D1|nr:NifU family protein [Xanthovirga aplysinae]MTI30411.1 NifU family protein [Xanthovirga aplysinae]
MQTINNDKQKRNVNIYMEANPNPNSMKFVANFMLLPDGVSYDYPNLESAEHSPLAKVIFQSFSYVERVFFMSNFVTITKAEGKDWEEIRTELKDFIKGYLEENKEIIIPEALREEVEINEEDSETVKKIKGILDEYIRPAVESDGGAITFHSYKEGVVKVLLQGACSGCPSSTVTLKSGIENLLKRMLPNEVNAVEAEGI